jgi:hypothetical protein
VGRLIVHGIWAAGITAILLLQVAKCAEPEKAYEREIENRRANDESNQKLIIQVLAPFRRRV